MQAETLCARKQNRTGVSNPMFQSVYLNLTRLYVTFDDNDKMKGNLIKPI